MALQYVKSKVFVHMCLSNINRDRPTMSAFSNLMFCMIISCSSSFFCFICLYVLLVEDTYHGSGKHTLSAGDIFGIVLFCIANIEESEQSFLVSVNCLDRHVATNPSTVAIIWEKNEPGEQEEITYKYVRHFNAFCYSIYMMDVQKGMYVFCLILGNFLTRRVR